MENKQKSFADYNDFLRSNRREINRYLNTILRFCILTGPAIALGIATGIFTETTYTACIIVSLYMLVLSTLHYFVLRHLPESEITSFLALLIMDVLLVYMSHSHIYIHITWFLIPMLSIIFCSKQMYFLMVVINYLLMMFSIAITAPYYSAVRTDYHSYSSYFANIAGGYTIETIIMAVAGYSIGQLATSYYQQLIEKYKTIREHEQHLKEQMETLDSMAEIYDNVNLLDFESMTEQSLRDGNREVFRFDSEGQTHTRMNQRLQKTVSHDQLEAFLAFTDITTVVQRLSGKLSISGEFTDRITGWFRAQYITIDTDKNGLPSRVIYTTQNIDAEKRREEHLLRISMTDELTRLYNRRCYYEDIREYNAKGLEDDFVIFSVDVNGLKTVNDNYGHAAGDELLKAAASCLQTVLGYSGKVYRTGGDEFLAIVHTSDPGTLKTKIQSESESWHGVYVPELSLSIGYATSIDNPGETVPALEKIADNYMYNEKELYYKNKGIDRRRR